MIDKKLKQLIYRNKEFIDIHIENLSDKKLKYIEYNMRINDADNKLKELLKKEFRSSVYDKIEHRIIIEELYSDEIKEEALNKLPLWIINLR